MQKLAAGSALMSLSACTTLDRWFMGGSGDEGDKVLIIGAGLAGLSAAYHLKKNQIPFRLFEGSGRIGGRIMTLRDFNISSRHAELAGDRIETEHWAIQALAQELKITLREVTTKENLAWFEKGRLFHSKDWKTEAVELQRLFRNVQTEAHGNLVQSLNQKNKDQFPKAVILDRMQASELLSRLESQFKPWMKPFLEQLIRSEWGVEPKELSALHLVHWVRDQFRVQNKKYFKVSGGSSILTQALYDRIGGVIPDRLVKFNHRLIAIQPEDSGWTLVFQTPTGKFEVQAEKVICTLPPALLRQVDGWQDLELSAEQKKLISEQDLGRHSKVVLSFQDRFWESSPVLASGGTLYTDMMSSSIFEGGDPVASDLQSLHGILEIQIGGEAGAQAGPHTIQQALKDLARVDSKSSSFESISHVQNWKLFPWSQGGRAYLKPGQFQLLQGPELTRGWTFAGDWHSLNWMGTMNGAVQTGLEAANRFLKTNS